MNIMFEENLFSITSVGCFHPRAQVQHLFKILSSLSQCFLLRAWLESPRRKTTSCGVRGLMGLTIVRPPKYICLSRWSQPTYVQGNLNRLIEFEYLNDFNLYRSCF